MSISSTKINFKTLKFELEFALVLEYESNLQKIHPEFQTPKRDFSWGNDGERNLVFNLGRKG